MLPSLEALSRALSAARWKRYGKLIYGFVSRVFFLNETREAKQIENMTRFLEATSKQFAVMKKNGCPDETIRELALELQVPLMQANLEAMLIARRMNTKDSADA